MVSSFENYGDSLSLLDLSFDSAFIYLSYKMEIRDLGQFDKQFHLLTVQWPGYKTHPLFWNTNHIAYVCFWLC